jgi:hypothetical protein
MLNRSLFVLLLLGGLMACSPQRAGDSTSVPSASLRSTLISQSAPAKTTTIQIEGKTQTIPLEFVQTRYFSTDFPTDRFIVKQDNSKPDQIQRTFFYWKKPDGTIDENASIIILFPADTASEQRLAEAFLLSDGLEFAINWRRIEQSSDISHAKRAYSAWLSGMEQFEQRTKSQNRAATVYQGEVQGRPFLIRSLYPLRYGDQFASREKVLLKNLKFEGKDKIKAVAR